MGLQIRSPAAQIKTLSFAHPSAATTKKLPFVLNAKTFIPLNSAASAAANEHVYECELSGAEKTTGQAWAVGETLYFDPATGKFTKTAGALVACGYCGEAMLSGDTTTGLVVFRGF